MTFGVAVLGLAATGRLTLYVHPRYVVLSVVMASVGVAVATLGLVLPAPADPHPDDHGGSHHDPAAAAPTAAAAPRGDAVNRAVRRVVGVGGAVVVALVVLAVLVLPPSTLSASLRDDRGLATSGRALESGPSEELVGADTSTFTVRDWAALLQQGGADAVVGQPVVVSGYVLDRGEDDMFVVARLMISCCAVDAQPVGVAVSRPGWRSTLRPDAWVEVRGTFVDVSGTDQADGHPAVVQPTEVTLVPEPKNPYVF